MNYSWENHCGVETLYSEDNDVIGQVAKVEFDFGCGKFRRYVVARRDYEDTVTMLYVEDAKKLVEDVATSEAYYMDEEAIIS